MIICVCKNLNEANIKFKIGLGLKPQYEKGCAACAPEWARLMEEYKPALTITKEYIE